MRIENKFTRESLVFPGEGESRKKEVVCSVRVLGISLLLMETDFFVNATLTH